MLFTLLVFGCAINNILGQEITQNNEQEKIMDQEKQEDQPKVLDRGLDTDFEGYTLNDVVEGKSDLKILVAKYNKKHEIEPIGFLNDLDKYPKAKEHIKRSNAVKCFNGMELRDSKGGMELKDSKGNVIRQTAGTIIVKTQNPYNCNKLYNMYEYEKNNVVDAKNTQQPKVISNGLATDFENSTLYKIAYESEGTEETASTELYTKDINKFKRVGKLKRLERYAESKAQIKQNNAVICFNAITRETRDGLKKKRHIIIDGTDDINDCVQFKKSYERQQREVLYQYQC